jgi:hypothetical protein
VKLRNERSKTSYESQLVQAVENLKVSIRIWRCKIVGRPTEAVKPLRIAYTESLNTIDEGGWIM